MTQRNDGEHKMSLRDAFAKAALQGMGTWTPALEWTVPDLNSELGLRSRAEFAYAQADAMLEARKK